MERYNDQSILPFLEILTQYGKTQAVENSRKAVVAVRSALEWREHSGAICTDIINAANVQQDIAGKVPRIRSISIE